MYRMRDCNRPAPGMDFTKLGLRGGADFAIIGQRNHQEKQGGASPLMTRIYLIRHAEAEGNLYRLSHGQYNSTVTPRGYRQHAALCRRSRDLPIEAVYDSDL